VGCEPAVRDGGEAGRECGAVAGHDDGAVVEVRAGHRERVGEIGELGRPVRLDVRVQAGGLGAQRLLGGARDREGVRLLRRGSRLGRCDRSLLQHHVRVGPADAEGGHACAEGAAVGLPRCRRGQEADGAR
jgi:hypothetical protein